MPGYKKGVCARQTSTASVRSQWLKVTLTMNGTHNEHALMLTAFFIAKKEDICIPKHFFGAVKINKTRHWIFVLLFKHYNLIFFLFQFFLNQPFSNVLFIYLILGP